MIERIHMKRSYETAASFFEKHSAFPLVSVIRRLYYCVFLRDSQRKVKYLRACGAKIGNGVNLRDLACLGSEPYLVEIGDNTSFSSNVRVVTHDGGTARLYYMGLTPQKCDNFGCVKIGKNCFIGMNAIILKNVRIGDNCIIGARSVVTKSIPANSIAAGVPAKVIGTVSDYKEKNCPYFDETVGMSPHRKREYIQEHFAKYNYYK